MLKLHCESSRMQDYLFELEEVDFRHRDIQLKVQELLNGQPLTEVEYIQKAYAFVRDQISHSWDIRSKRVTRTASEVLLNKEGICYAKSNLLAALLRANHIPTGFCYQRLTLGDTPDTGYCIHALNAVYITDLKNWVRLDARGNKDGVHAEFSADTEKLAFPIREEYAEHDYSTIYAKPNSRTMDVLKKSNDCMYMCLNELPTEI
ncbi:transglutaminase-like domain-containing protein [Cohnella cholangitidis]|uniref:Transglutaminase family protein n=1 Tax=Cohnella cholangitidis TaxID=2598458 RepID=A0A7G5BST8_9BACL|nr:transglutaminase family protein [Cohnella cholangitidis]QMV40022.1 transglutaminase family protein [Cohnella cholangitidis]